jgi:hypothetical protein
MVVRKVAYSVVYLAVKWVVYLAVKSVSYLAV